MTTNVVGRLHIEAETDTCTCVKFRGCGGIKVLKADCVEHGFDTKPEGLFHTHALQVDRVTRGRWVP